MKQHHAIETISNTVIALLKQGVEPWRPRWDNIDLHPLPYNLSTRQGYRGFNIVSFLVEQYKQGYDFNAWLTFKQAKALGGHVKKGEKGTYGGFYKAVPRDSELSADDEEQTFFPMWKWFVAYNIDQIEGVDLAGAEDSTGFHSCVESDSPLSKINQLRDRYCEAQGIQISYGGSQAYYSPSNDQIRLPKNFHEADGYLSTLLHEMVHSTGHDQRLGRFKANETDFQDDDENYAYEELVAALGENMLCAHLGVHSMQSQHVSYIGHWIKALDQDHSLIYRAATAASKAIDLILEHAEEPTLDQ